MCRRLVQSVVFLFLLFGATFVAQAQNNSITGLVFDANSRQPVGDLYVELLDSIGFTLARARIDSSGRFIFRGLRAGNFQIKILTFGTNYKEENSIGAKNPMLYEVGKKGKAQDELAAERKSVCGKTIDELKKSTKLELRAPNL